MQPLNEKDLADSHKQITMQMTVMEGVALLGTLQLALRHPQFKKRPTAKWIKEFAAALQQKITTEAPGLSFLCEAGWNPKFDQ